MLKVDKAIFDANDAICDNISQISLIGRGLSSQNILGHLRNFVEYIAIKEYGQGRDVDPNDYSTNTAALKYIKSRGDLRFLYKFHSMLQKSVSHYTMDKDGSERLLLKYYEHLLKVRAHLKQKFDIDVLENISEFPLDTDTELSSYYRKIAEAIELPSSQSHPVSYNDRYYVRKVKPFFIDEKVYYEITFSVATANISKFDRLIAFTRHEIVDNYAIKFTMHSDTIRVLDKEMSILVVDAFEVSIRPCEWDNFSEIFGPRIRCSAKSSEYKELMRFLSTIGMSLTELVCSEDPYYDFIKNKVTSQGKSSKIFGLLDECRNLIINKGPGANILRYLLYNMNNSIIKQQSSREKCARLSNMFLCFGCLPFDQMPYCTSLIGHNPRIYDLLDSIPVDGREHELLARLIKNNTEIGGHLFTPESEIEGYSNIDALINKHNSSLYYKHTRRRLEKYKKHIYIKGYAEDSAEIIKSLQALASSGVSQYETSVDSWLMKESYVIDDENKKDALRQMFCDSHVALIYGSAGTGKSTLIRHISNFWTNKKKIFLANTHPAVDNMRRKVTAGNSTYGTIAKFLSGRNQNVDCDILFIDECSTVSNDDMRRILEKANFKLLVLVGDIFQIESIYFGNWFSIARGFMPKTSVFELTRPFRTTNSGLLTVWDRVRSLNDAILEPMVKNGCVARLDESVFEHSDGDDEIILCLNYDGLYGINNINRFLQSNNPNRDVIWGINTYKVDDPILFNESSIFSPLIHNNSKGRIVGITPGSEQIQFEVELEDAINEIDASDYSFDLIGKSAAGKSIILFSVNKYRSTDVDDDIHDPRVVPFQVAYAVSIHKAQGLEYDSVKIVITNEVEERITHNIFYTAITRAKNRLKIYWSPETCQSVINHLEIKNPNADVYLLSQLATIGAP